MVDFRASRPMEDFFLNPTTFTTLPTTKPRIMSVDYTSTHSQQSDYFTDSSKLAPLESTPSLADLTRKTTMWSNGYTSDEEVASPIDDDMSMRSGSSISIGSIISLHDQLADSCNQTEQRCDQAQAVRIQAVGKPRVVELPKLDLSYRRRPVRPASVVVNRTSRPVSPKQRLSDEIQSARSSQDSHYDSSSMSSPRSPASTAPSSISEEQSAEEPQKPKPQNLYLQRNTSTRRHIDLLEAARSPTSVPNSPMFPRSVDQVKRQSTTLSDRSSIVSASPVSPAIRKFSQFSSKLSIGRKSSVAHNVEDLESVKEPEPLSVAQQTPQLQLPTRRSSMQPKMMARGANERAPTITLPPFPGSSEEVSDSDSEVPSRADSIRTLKRKSHIPGRSQTGTMTPVA